MQKQLPLNDQVDKQATISSCGRYRYSLQRVWAPEQKWVMMIGLNPSIADAELDDPTIRRCIRFAHGWGYGGLIMANLFAYRSTDPRQLMAVPDPIGPENDAWIVQLATQSSLVVAAWGNYGIYQDRCHQIKRMNLGLHILKLNQSGQPAHPLYLKGGLKPRKWVD